MVSVHQVAHNVFVKMLESDNDSANSTKGTSSSNVMSYVCGSYATPRSQLAIKNGVTMTLTIEDKSGFKSESTISCCVRYAFDVDWHFTTH